MVHFPGSPFFRPWLPAVLPAFLVLTGAALAAAPAPDRRFPPDAVVDVTLPPYGARPDDGVDDTDALQRAISENAGAGRVLFLPAGTYEITRPLVAKNAAGLWRAQLTLQGQGRDRTILRLADHAPGFNDPSHPQAVLVTGSHEEPGDDPAGGGNKAFRNNLFDLTVDTGSGNAGAIGVEYAVSNHGAIANVTVRSGDGRGVAGIAQKRRIPGPGLIKHVAVAGFDVGIDVDDIQYGMTLEHVTVRDQRTAGIRVSQNLLHVRGLESVNRVPAVLVTAPEGVLTLLDARLAGGDASVPAVDCAGSLLVRNVVTRGYHLDAIRCRGRAAPGGPPYAGWAWPAALGAGAPETALLPVEETPEYWNADLADWEPVGPRRPGEPDDTAAFQRAVDAGKSTVYLPHSRTYFLSDTVIVRGKVRQILGMGAEISLGAARAPFGDRDHPRPLLRIDPTAGPAVFLENLFVNAQYPGEVVFENNSPRTVVIRHCGGWVGADGSRRSYRNTARGTGKLFVEDVFLPGWEFTGQTVWARQFNPENWDGDGSSPQVLNRGGRLWVLGFKTEGSAPFLATAGGGVTELLGAYNYVSATKADRVPAAAVPYPVTDSTAALTFVTENFRDNDYAAQIRVAAGGRVREELKGGDLWPRNGRPGDRSFAVPLYRAPGAAASVK